MEDNLKDRPSTPQPSAKRAFINLCPQHQAMVHDPSEMPCQKCVVIYETPQPSREGWLTAESIEPSRAELKQGMEESIAYNGGDPGDIATANANIDSLCRMALAALSQPAGTEWRPIDHLDSNSHPQNVNCLVYKEGHPIGIAHWSNPMSPGGWTWGWNIHFEPTHFMPLPAPPRDGDTPTKENGR
jgi:hypothetical protein